MKQAAPFGTWPSPLGASAVAAGALRLGSVIVEGRDIYWLEARPDEGGRGVVVRRDAHGNLRDQTPAGTNVRSRVHEYGGAAYIVSQGVIYYTEFADQRLYRLEPGGRPEPLTPAGDWFHADCAIDPVRPRLVSVREDHSVGGREAVAELVSVPLRGPESEVRTLVAGHDFYAAPRFSPDGARLSWLAWRHPQMPWDGTELWIADLDSHGNPGPPTLVAGGEQESVFQPGWAPDAALYFVSDRSGWWNLYRRRGSQLEPVCPMAADFGRPLWQLGTTTWAAIDAGRLAVSYAVRGQWRLAVLDLATARLDPLAVDIEAGDSLDASPTQVVLVGGSPAEPDRIVAVDLATGTTETIRGSAPGALAAAFVSTAEPMTFPSEGGLEAHAFYYAPSSGDFAGPPDERPPLIVIAHGGPTAATHARLNLEVQYWTTRGFAVVDVNYGGSTGYGRAYRRRLTGRWGIVDVADCRSAARHLASNGLADPNRVLIRGRSAGGYTTLAALTEEPCVFQAGASYYGIADLERLAQETHKFESRYLDTLIGPYPSSREQYLARSPISRLHALSSPLILFQGLEDPVVPAAQARLMADAVRDKGLPVALLIFSGEQHGFRRAETIVACLEAELSFYAAVLGLRRSDGRAIDIENLEGWRAARAGPPGP